MAEEKPRDSTSQQRIQLKMAQMESSSTRSLFHQKEEGELGGQGRRCHQLLVLELENNTHCEVECIAGIEKTAYIPS